MYKKTIIAFFAILCTLIFGEMNVYAAKSCAYGVRDSNGKNWQKLITFEVQSWNNVKIDGTNTSSPMFSYVTWKKGEEPAAVTGEKYQLKGRDAGWWPGEYFFYVSLYPFEATYKTLKGECPATIKYEIKTEGGAADDHHFLFYNDDLDKPLPKDSFILYNHYGDYADTSFTTKLGFNASSGRLVLEKNKDKPLEELVDEYDCFTYSTGLQAIKDAVDESESKSCDNNVEFNKNFQQLQSLCDYYRSTSMYAEASEDDKLTAKACSKACSMINDDVSSICEGKNNDNWFCGSLGNGIVTWIFKIIRFVRYAIPALLIILSILDYIKALASDNEDEMKKVTGRFVKRLIAAALIFIIPFILDFILRMFNIPGLNADNPFCAN